MTAPWFGHILESSQAGINKGGLAGASGMVRRCINGLIPEEEAVKKPVVVMVALSFVSVFVLGSNDGEAQTGEMKPRYNVQQPMKPASPPAAGGPDHSIQLHSLEDRQYKACSPAQIYLGDELKSSIGEIISCNVSDRFGGQGIKPGSLAAKKSGSTCTVPPSSAGPIIFHCTTPGIQSFVVITFRAWQAGGKGPVRQVRFSVDCVK